MSEQIDGQESFGFGVEFIEWPKPVPGSYDEETETEAAEVALVQVPLGAQPCILIKPNREAEGNMITVNVSEMELSTAAFILGSIADGLKDALRETGDWNDDDEPEVTSKVVDNDGN